jgi:hypothetical protein
MAMLAGAFAAAPSSAHEFHFETQSILVGEQVEGIGISTEGGTIGCASLKLEGTTSALATGEIKVSPTYGGCSTVGFPVAVNMNGCWYVFGGKTIGKDTEFRLECGAGEKMEVVVNPAFVHCTAKLSPQTSSQGVGHANVGSGAQRELVTTFTTKPMTYEKVGKTCAFFGNGKDLNLTGTVKTKAFVDESGTPGKQAGIWVE